MWATARPVLAAFVVLAGARVGAAPAEDCPEVTIGEARASVESAVAWFAANQDPDGSWAYLVDDAGSDLGGYNAVRHAGVLLSLEQASAAGVDGAGVVADRGWGWAERHLVDAGPGRALALPDEDPPTGATALLVRAALEAGPDGRDDELLDDLGRFLLGQVLPSGAVSARFSLADGEAIPEARDRFFTGETLWALVGLAERFPADDELGAAAERVGAYVPTADQAEDRFPPSSDHWASYAYGDLGDRMTPLQVAHARRLVGIVGVQVRGEATRWRGGLQRVVRGGPAVGSGLGTLGEAGGGLRRALGDEPATDGLDERLRCVAGMLVARQASGNEPAVAGAWFTRGRTRMDDQQHAISALLAAEPVLAASEPADAVGGGEQRHPAFWLGLLGLVAAHPLRPGRRLHPLVVLAGAAVAAALVAGSGPLLDALDVSPGSARAAAGASMAVAAVATVARPSTRSGVVAGSLVVVALALGADDGARALAAVGLGAGALLLVPDRWRQAASARALAVASLLLAADLVVDGVLGV